MDWHSTGVREELLIGFSGRMRIELGSPERVRRTITLRSGQSAFLPIDTWHRVVNQTHGEARYIYVTAPAP